MKLMVGFLSLLSTFSVFTALAAVPPGLGGASSRGDGAQMAYDSIVLAGRPTVATGVDGDVVKFKVVKVLRGESLPSSFSCGVDDQLSRYIVPYESYILTFNKDNICRGEAFVIKDPATQSMVKSAQAGNLWKFKDTALYQEILDFGSRN